MPASPLEAAAECLSSVTECMLVLRCKSRILITENSRGCKHRDAGKLLLLAPAAASGVWHTC